MARCNGDNKVQWNQMNRVIKTVIVNISKKEYMEFRNEHL